MIETKYSRFTAKFPVMRLFAFIQYDTTYRLKTVTGNNPEAFTYDPTGNRTSGPGSKDTAYQHDAANRMTAGRKLSYYYDNNGNQITRTHAEAADKFMAAIEEKYLVNKEPDRNLPELRKITKRLSLEAIIEASGSCFNERLAGKASIYINHKYSGARLKEIGERFGIGESAVSQASKRFAQKMAKDAELKNLVEKLHAKLRNVNV